MNVSNGEPQNQSGDSYKSDGERFQPLNHYILEYKNLRGNLVTYNIPNTFEHPLRYLLKVGPNTNLRGLHSETGDTTQQNEL